jgi:hypothetical protein
VLHAIAGYLSWYYRPLLSHEYTNAVAQVKALPPEVQAGRPAALPTGRGSVASSQLLGPYGGGRVEALLTAALTSGGMRRGARARSPVDASTPFLVLEAARQELTDTSTGPVMPSSSHHDTDRRTGERSVVSLSEPAACTQSPVNSVIYPG